MKILVICQYYYPEPFRISDICEELVKRGHEVTVITGLPNYPMGEIYPDYRNGEKRDETINGVKVYRCFTVGRKRGIVCRFLNYYSYAVSSVKYVKQIKEKYDVVFVNQLSPVMMANAAIAYKQKYKTKIVLYCLDLWPESLTVGGISRHNPLYRYFHKVSERIYRQCDKILVTSRSFLDYFEKEFGIAGTEYLPQYAESVFSPGKCGKEADKYTDLMFAGNIGKAQSLDTIITAVRKTSDIPNLRWHIVGDGSELEKMKKKAEGMERIIFYGRQSLDEMPEYYSMADAMLVTTQRDPVLSLTMPGKVQTYMAAGKPIIGAVDGETQIVLNEARCGICGRAEDADMLVDSVRAFMRADREQLGKNARTYYEEHFDKQVFINRLELALKAVQGAIT